MQGIRLIVLIVAVGSAIGAVAIVRNALDNQPVQIISERQQTTVPIAQIEKTEVLVAAKDLKMGEAFTPATLKWQVWPADAVVPNFITRKNSPNARESLGKAIVRNYVVAGEPITEAKMLNLDNASVMSVLLRDGMRAISVKIAPETGAGGFILPGDYVDVLLTRQRQSETNQLTNTKPEMTAETLLSRVRILAIDQIFNETGESSSAVGRTATLEVFPEQAEIIAQSEQRGVVTLTLRGMSELLDGDGNVIRDPLPITVVDEEEKIAQRKTIIVLRNGKPTKVLTDE